MEIKKLRRVPYKVLVTGASGFLGSIIAKYLYDEGFIIIGVYNHSSCNGTFPSVKCDLNSVIKKNDIPMQPDIIVHCAGLQPFSSPWYNRGKRPSAFDYLKSNVYSMQNIIRFAERVNCKRIINISTIGIYGEIVQEVMDEESPKVNADDYGITKYYAERLLKEAKFVKGISLRLPGIIGKGTRGIWAARTIEKMKRNEEVDIYSPDFVTKNFVHVDDLSRFVKKLIMKPDWKYEELVLGCEKGEKIRDIVECMKCLTGSESELIVKQGERKSFCINAERAFEMGYKSHSPLEIIEKYCKEIKKYQVS